MKTEQAPNLKWRVEFYSGGFEVIEAPNFETAAKLVTRMAKRYFLRVSALIQSSTE
jgi:hypothetical protein